jgi:hypothetical protein
MPVDIKEIKKLPQAEKQKLLWFLLDDLEDMQPGDIIEEDTGEESPAVIAMLEKRLADIKSGKAQMIPWEESRAILKKNMEEYRNARYGKK